MFKGFTIAGRKLFICLKFRTCKFDIDGLKVLDYKNPQVKVGTEVYGSVVEVCASVPRFDQYVHAGSEVEEMLSAAGVKVEYIHDETLQYQK